MLWPYWCGRVFPCDSHPADGVRFTLRLRGVPEGRTAVYPSEIRFDAPPYMLAFAVGEYVREELGRTRAGTRVSVWYFPNDAELARRGTSGLVSAIDFLERTYGPYRFGGSVGSVEANWRGLSAGAMEHHPFWHVTRASLDDQETHIHEAAHGWFGNGVRIRCWEDFVLSEGVASYLAVRAIESTRGAAEGEAIWRSYRGRLARVVRGGDTAAWPRGCNRIDILHHRLWSDIPYMKGAFFLRDVAERVGRARLDAALARFYAERVGTAAGFDDLLDTIRRETHFDPEPLVSRWLR